MTARQRCSEDPGAVAVQRRPRRLTAATVDREVRAGIEATRGRGSQLDAGVRARIGRGALRDALGDVRVHDDAAAGQLARAVQARAFTTGPDIYFAPGEYRPGTWSGDRLLAHELAHVVQQRGNARGGPIRMIDSSSADEVAAETFAGNLAGGAEGGVANLRVDGPHTSAVLARMRDPDVEQGDKKGTETQATVKVIFRGFDGIGPFSHKIFFQAGETVEMLKRFLANNYPMSWSAVSWKATALARTTTAPAGTDALAAGFYTFTVDVPSAAADDVKKLPEAKSDVKLLREQRKVAYLKLYELGELDATKSLVATLPAEGESLWVLPSTSTFTIGNVKNAYQIADRPDLTPMIQIGDVYASMTITGSGTWPGVVRQRFNAVGSDRATKFSIFTGTHGNIGGQKLDATGSHWESETGTKAGAADFPQQDQSRANDLQRDLSGCSIDVIDVWDKAGTLSGNRTRTRDESTDPFNLLVEPAKLKAAVRAELAKGRVVILAWCFSVEAFKVARFAGAPLPASEQATGTPSTVSETDYVTARNAVPLNQIVTELFDGGAGAWTRPAPPPVVPHAPAKSNGLLTREEILAMARSGWR